MNNATLEITNKNSFKITATSSASPAGQIHLFRSNSFSFSPGNEYTISFMSKALKDGADYSFRLYNESFGDVFIQKIKAGEH
ncbi:hypothetical protein [Paraclostridium dentum]|uniref:hypothetical protein n=1 Tax=Paraclostridium dentum TaxID=2662455 RepID=UPI003F3AB5EA